MALLNVIVLLVLHPNITHLKILKIIIIIKRIKECILHHPLPLLLLPRITLITERVEVWLYLVYKQSWKRVAGS